MRLYTRIKIIYTTRTNVESRENPRNRRHIRFTYRLLAQVEPTAKSNLRQIGGFELSEKS